MTDIDIKPCPFCGRQPEYNRYPSCTIIECDECGISFSASDGPKANNSEPPYHEDTIKKWNKRDIEHGLLNTIIKELEEIEYQAFEEDPIRLKIVDLLKRIRGGESE